MSFLFWSVLLLQVRALRSFPALSGFRPLTSLICFLWLVKALEHNCPFVTDFGFLHFWLGLGSSLFVLPFPLCWVLCLIQLVRFQHLESLLRYRFDINSLTLGLEISFLLKGGEGESTVFERGGVDESMKRRFRGAEVGSVFERVKRKSRASKCRTQEDRSVMETSWCASSGSSRINNLWKLKILQPAAGPYWRSAHATDC
jgi:hypothetical protein